MELHRLFLDASGEVLHVHAGELLAGQAAAGHPSNGKMVMNTRMMPAPPSHWVMLLQKSRLFGHDSMFSIMVAPVVVKPLMVSNRASTMFMP